MWYGLFGDQVIRILFVLNLFIKTSDFIQEQEYTHQLVMGWLQVIIHKTTYMIHNIIVASLTTRSKQLENIEQCRWPSRWNVIRTVERRRGGRARIAELNQMCCDVTRRWPRPNLTRRRNAPICNESSLSVRYWLNLPANRRRDVSILAMIAARS